MKKALSFLTIFGASGTPNQMTLAWFPIVGALLGLTVGAIWWLVAKAWPPLPTAAVVVSADLVLTGFLHFDGLADTADGLIAPLTKQRRLEAMADPTIGAFGAIGVVMVLLLRFSALATLRPAPFVVAGLWCASRTSMVLIAETLPYARPTGLVRDFLGAGSRSTRQRFLLLSAIIFGFVLAATLAISERGARGLVAIAAELAAMGAVVLFSKHRIGGYTGDVLGAAGVIGETIGLLVLASR
jgi:adenosylcobinamide-GDP ribazoletransferase